jgi:uncharacterized membrane protein
MLSRIAKSGVLPRGSSDFEFLKNPKIAYPLTALAIAEVLADKLPFVPKRTKVLPLFGRAVTGGVTGAAICAAKGKPAWLGAVVGAAAAVGGAYAAYHLRHRIASGTRLPDTVVGLLEDAVVAGAGMLILKRLRSEESELASV